MKLDKNIPNWDKDAVWENVASELHQKKKRRVMFWWLTGIASLVLVAGLAIWSLPSQNYHATANKKDVVGTEQNRNAAPINTEVNIDLISHKNINQNIKVKQKFSPKILNRKRQLFSALESNTNKLANSSNTSSTQTNKIGNRNTSANIGTAPMLGPSTNLENSSILKIDLFPLEPLKILPLAPFPPHLPENDWTKKIYLFNPIKIEKQKRANTLWVETGTSFGKKSKRFLDEITPSVEATGGFRFIHTNGIGVQRPLNKFLSFKIGLGYQTIYEKYDFTSVNVIEEEGIVPGGIVYNLPNGESYSEPGFAKQISTQSRSIINNNFTHRFSIPSELVFTLRKNNWSFEIATGSRFIFYRRFDGVFTQRGQHLFDSKEINDTYFNKNFSLGLMVSLNMKYSISERGSLGLKLAYEKDDFLGLIKTGFSKQYETIGIHAGYHHSF